MEFRYSLLLAAVLLPAGAGGQESVRVVGEVRIRPEAERPSTTTQLDAFSLLRTRLGVEATLSEHARVFVQVQDARTFGEEASTTDADADRLDMHQAWLQYGGAWGDHAWSVRAGRQEIALGNERLVGSVGWSNTGRSFDAVRATLGPSRTDAWTLSALVATVQERGRRFTGADSAGDHVLIGTFLAVRPLELFVLHDREAAYRSATGVDRTTLGGRATAPAVGGFTASLEGAYQLGNQLLDAVTNPVAQDISAFLVGARISYATDVDLLSKAGLGLDYLSGDEAPADDTYGALNTLYATNHKFYGYIDFFLDPAARTRDRGLIDGIASIALGLPRDLALAVDAHGFWTAQRLAPGADRLIGHELDLTLPVRLGTGQMLQLGYSTFRNGPAAIALGLGRDGAWSHWAYIQATFSFGGPPGTQR